PSRAIYRSIQRMDRLLNIIDFFGKVLCFPRLSLIGAHLNRHEGVLASGAEIIRIERLSCFSDQSCEIWSDRSMSLVSEGCVRNKQYQREKGNDFPGQLQGAHGAIVRLLNE